MTRHDTVLRALCWQLQAGLQPVQTAAADPAATRHMLAFLGFAIPSEYRDISESLADVSAAVTALQAAAIDQEQDFAALLDAMADVWDALDDLDDDVQTVLDSAGLTDEVTLFAEAIARLPQHLVILRLSELAPLLVGILRLLGIIDQHEVAAVEVFHQSRLESFAQDPGSYLATLYGWSDPDGVDERRMLEGIRRLLNLMGVVPQLRSLPVALRGGDTSPPPRGIDLDLYNDGESGIPVRAGVYIGPTQAGDGWVLAPYSTLTTSSVDAGSFSFTLPTEISDLSFGVEWTPSGLDIVGTPPDSVSFAVEAIQPLRFGHGVKPLVEVIGTQADIELVFGTSPDVLVNLDTGTIRVHVDLTSDTGVFKDLIGGGFSVEASGALSWSASGELDLDFAAGGEILIAASGVSSDGDSIRSPLRVRYLRLFTLVEIKEDAPPVITIGGGITLALQLGPVEATLGGLGLAAELTFGHAKGARGNLGPANLGIEVLKPNEIGLAIDAAPVSGSGYLRWLDKRYEGALQLTLGEVQLTALGLLETSDPWSLLALVGARFPGIPVGFGFSLTGVGGLVAIHRDMDLKELQASVRTGQLTALLAPDDIAGREPEILAALDLFFPTSPGRFSGGLFITLVWGPEDLWVTDLGVFLSLPTPIKIALVGSSRVRVLNPASVGKSEAELTREDEVFAIRLDLLGTYDSSIPEVTVDAALIDSHVATIPLEGAAHFRWRGGASPDFVLTVGGFHPSYQPPPGTTVPNRLRFGIQKTSFSLAFEAYVALTPNTLQFGGALVLAAEALGFVVSGGFALDVLIHFKPFGFQTDVAAWFELLTQGGRAVASFQASGSLSGPTPWTFAATVSVKVLGVKVEGQVSGTIGKDAGADEPVQAAAVITMTHTRLNEDDAWGVERTDTYLCLADTDSIVLLPTDELNVAQEVAPLGAPLEHLHGQPLLGMSDLPADVVTIEVVPSDTDLEVGNTELPFAPASWKKLPDADRITAPGFESGQAGLALTCATQSMGASVAPPSYTHEITVLDGTNANMPSGHSHTPARRRVA